MAMNSTMIDNPPAVWCKVTLRTVLLATTALTGLLMTLPPDWYPDAPKFEGWKDVPV